MKSEIMKFRYTLFIRAYFEGKTKEQIMQEINISSATYYRYRNMYLKNVLVWNDTNMPGLSYEGYINTNK